MLNLNHKNLDVWKVSLLLIKDIYLLTENYPKSEIYGLTSQLRRASISVNSNISEGSSRRTPAERKRFFEVARSSVVEIDTQIEISILLGFTKEASLTAINEKTNELFAKITNLINKT